MSVSVDDVFVATVFDESGGVLAGPERLCGVTLLGGVLDAADVTFRAAPSGGRLGSVLVEGGGARIEVDLRRLARYVVPGSDLEVVWPAGGIGVVEGAGAGL